MVCRLRGQVALFVKYSDQRFIRTFYSLKSVHRRESRFGYEKHGATIFGICQQRQIHGKPWRSKKDWDTLAAKGNLVLMGLPGSGKTTTGRLIAQSLGKKCLDVDDDLLQPLWGTSVADKLKQIGDHRFLEEEGKALLSLDVRDTVISLTGSNPLHHDGMAIAAELGLCIYLDAANHTILGRQKDMKVDRIIGMSDGSTLEDVINYRRRKYEMWHDVRVMVHPSDTPDDVAARVLDVVSRPAADAGHVSTRNVTRNDSEHFTFLEAVLQGLAPDGGLFVKAGRRPRLSRDDLNTLVTLNTRERALRVLETWIHPSDIAPQHLHHFLENSFTRGLFDHPDMCPVIPLTKNVYTQELFHGPTASFKDYALQLMPRFFAHAAAKLRPDSKFLILAATSGDTGSATLDGFARHASKAKVGALVLYPSQNISEIQRQQTVTMEGNNVKVIGVDGDFDFCQATVKQIFQDQEMQRSLGSCQLSAANSINWGRLLPQVLYHVSAYLDLVKEDRVTMGDLVDYCVPTGNFGNILSAYYAKEMGVPIRRLICASNSNNILTDFLTTGSYSPAKYILKTTISPSIDIITSSNLERFLYHMAGDNPEFISQFYKDVETVGGARVSDSLLQHMQSFVTVGFASEQDTLDTIQTVYKDSGYILDPHTAVGYHVTTKVGDPNTPTIVSGTAHFGKFVDNVLPALGRDLKVKGDQMSVSQLLTVADSLSNQPKPNSLLSSVAAKPVLHSDTLPADYRQICASILAFAHSF